MPGTVASKENEVVVQALEHFLCSLVKKVQWNFEEQLNSRLSAVT